MNLKKRILCFSLLGALAAGSFIIPINSVSAAVDTKQTVLTINEKQARVSWKGDAYVVKGKWTNVTASNNIFPDSPSVTNSANSPGTIKVRIVNDKGLVVGEVKTVKAGSSVELDNIPAFSGTYTLQANAVDKSGTYNISID